MQCFLLKCWTLGYTWQRGAVCIGEAMQISQIFVSSTSCWVNLIGWTHDLYIFGVEKWIAYEMWRYFCVFSPIKTLKCLDLQRHIQCWFCVLWNDSIEAWDQATGPPCFCWGRLWSHQMVRPVLLESKMLHFEAQFHYVLVLYSL